MTKTEEAAAEFVWIYGGQWTTHPFKYWAETFAAAMMQDDRGGAAPAAVREAWTRIDKFCRKRIAGPTATVLDDLRVVAAALAADVVSTQQGGEDEATDPGSRPDWTRRL